MLPSSGVCWSLQWFTVLNLTDKLVQTLFHGYPLNTYNSYKYEGIDVTFSTSKIKLWALSNKTLNLKVKVPFTGNFKKNRAISLVFHYSWQVLFLYNLFCQGSYVRAISPLQLQAELQAFSGGVPITLQTNNLFTRNSRPPTHCMVKCACVFISSRWARPSCTSWPAPLCMWPKRQNSCCWFFSFCCTAEPCAAAAASCTQL